MSSESVPATAPTAYIRPVQLVAGIICMVMIANLQYGWTLFVNPIDLKHHWGRAAIQVAFTIFVLTETWLVPVEGWLVDRFGPKIVVLVGGILVAIAGAFNSVANALTTLYVAAAIGGIGAGAVYGTCVGNALKWFPDRSLAAGLTAAGFWRRIGFDDHSDPRDDPDERVRCDIEAAGIWALGQFGRDPVLFVILGGVVFFAWSEIYSLFPSTCTDVFGGKYATTNAGLLYTAKGTASLLVPLASLLAAARGDWRAVFLAAALMNLAASIMALAVLKPLRAVHDKTADRIRPARLQHP
jgi:Major Facilitator Superfamily